MESILIPQSLPLVVHRIPRFLPTSRTFRCNSQSHRCVSLKSEEMALTRKVFDEMPITDAFAWNSLIRFHLSAEELDHVVSIYRQMLLRGVRPDKHTLPRVLGAARHLNSLYFGKQLHGHAVKLSLSSKDYVLTALMELYDYFDCVEAVKLLVDTAEAQMSLVSWTLLIRMHMKQYNPRLAIDTFYKMVGLGVEADAVAVMTAIGACGMLKSLPEGRKLEEIARESGLESDVLVGNSLLKMYIDCGSIKSARRVFDRMLSKDLISWTEMISGHVRSGGFNEGLKLFRNMVSECVQPDGLAISTILPACARMTAHKQGKGIHAYLVKNNVDMNLTLHNALMDMYVKSGFIEYASKIFSQLATKDGISWTIMIQGYSLHGQGAKGVELFREMQDGSEIEIGQITYTAVLHACNSANMLEEGRLFYGSVKKPDVRHCALMVSLLARAGLFDEAKAFIAEKHIARYPEVLRALLEGCRLLEDSKAGKQVVEQLYDLHSLDPDSHTLLSNEFGWAKSGVVGRWKEMITETGLKPKKDYSWIEFRNKVHVFGTGDVSHPKSENIYQELTCLATKVEEHGFFSEKGLDFPDCIEKGHNEMLAISFGLMSSQRSTIRITKNFHICRNCHEMAKAISKLVAREIILKDPNGFHHFKDEHCSCGNFW